MDLDYLADESDLSDFASLWEKYTPIYAAVYCVSGEARLTVMFKHYTLTQGQTIIICEDMYPSIDSRSEDFKAMYCIADRDLVDSAMRDIPYNVFDSFYINPIVRSCEGIQSIFSLLISLRRRGDSSYRKSVLSDLLHTFMLTYHLAWVDENGDLPGKPNRNPAENICNSFYNLVSDHFTEHRDTAYYAGQLCISSGYLATVMKRFCGESPKDTIDRMVTLEMKYILRNTSMPIKEIASRLNFPDTSYMCRFFKKKTGLSLSEYREALVPE